LEVIPAIDLRDGKLVRLAQGDYARETVYDPDPARVAASFAAAGAPRIHVVDLDGARDGSATNEPAIRDILAHVGEVPVQVGGGIRSLERVEHVLGLGAARVVMGTAALENPDLLREAARAHPACVVLGLDARDGRVAVHGWRETSGRSVEEVLDTFAELPLAAILHTDIARDGMLQGPNLEATVALARRTSIPVIASGGVSSVDDLIALARTQVIAGAVFGRAIYEGRVDVAAAIEAVAAC
jgi:phosphoribosylformimino-5-aminoimidazole carboxamide ribotide isomerase